MYIKVPSDWPESDKYTQLKDILKYNTIDGQKHPIERQIENLMESYQILLETLYKKQVISSVDLSNIMGYAIPALNNELELVNENQ